MKKIGIIGGLTYTSSIEAYRLLVEKTNQYLGGQHTAEIFVLNINPVAVFNALHAGHWATVLNELLHAAQNLQQVGCACIVIPCNTVHKIADELQKNISIPLINMLDCVGTYIKKNNYSRAGLLGTLFTMEHEFYRQHLLSHYQIQTIIPEIQDRKILHQFIFDELCHGKFSLEAKFFVRKLCNKMSLACDAVILGCTELPLLMQGEYANCPLINTIEVQADATLEFFKKSFDKTYFSVSGL